MLHPGGLKALLLSFCIIFSAFTTLSVANTVSLKRAMKAKMINVDAISTGGASRKSIRLQMTNNTDKELIVNVDPGLIFSPQDTVYQDLVLLGSETLVLAPSERKNIDLQTFCGKFYGRGPIPNLKYDFHKQGDSNMVKMLVYAKNNNIPIPVIQRAVWTFTNGKCLNTVYDSYWSRQSEDLVGYIASMKKMTMPEFYTEYKIQDRAGELMCASGHSKVYATIHWDNGASRNVYVIVYKQNGEIYKTIEADRIIDSRGSTVQVEFDSNRDPDGTYAVRAHDENGRVLDQKVVMVGTRECDMPKM